MSFAKLDREKILNEALALLEKGGLASISLRRVAKGLDVGVASLYWHVKDKDELLSMMAESIYLDFIRSVPAVSNGQEWLREFGVAMWKAQSRVPDMRQLIVQAPIREDKLKSTDDVVVAKLRDLGLEDGDLALRSVRALVTGWTMLSARMPSRLAHDEQDFRLVLDVLLRGLTVPMTTH